MFINKFLIKNLGAKEHFFFEINKYFGEKKCIIVHKHPLIVHIFGFFFPFLLVVSDYFVTFVRY